MFEIKDLSMIYDMDKEEKVYAMKSIGVVNGYSDGSFRPKGYATRAEVATMFGNLYTYLYG